MSKVKVGYAIPDLTGKALSGKEINLSSYIGKPLILSFYRYAGCQFCNLRMHHFTKKYNSIYSPAGINAIAVFQSPVHKLRKYTAEHEAPFEIISDPKYKWYKAFGVEKSWSAFFKTGKNVLGFYESIAKGYGRVDPDGTINRIPADFLISPEGKVEEAYYGKDISDHIPFTRIQEWMDEMAIIP